MKIKLKIKILYYRVKWFFKRKLGLIKDDIVHIYDD